MPFCHDNPRTAKYMYEVQTAELAFGPAVLEYRYVRVIGTWVGDFTSQAPALPRPTDAPKERQWY